MGRAHNQAIDITTEQVSKHDLPRDVEQEKHNATLATTNRQCGEVRVNQYKIKNKKAQRRNKERHEC